MDILGGRVASAYGWKYVNVKRMLEQHTNTKRYRPLSVVTYVLLYRLKLSQECPLVEGSWPCPFIVEG
jgi:hypothetical protein